MSILNMITSYADSHFLSFYIAIFVFTLLPWALRFSRLGLRDVSAVPLANPPKSLFGTGKTRVCASVDETNRTETDFLHRETL